MKIVNLFLLHENTAGQDHSLIFTEFGPQHLEITEMSRDVSRAMSREMSREVSRDVSREMSRDVSREMSREVSREISRCLTRSTAGESGTENYSLKEW